MLLLFFLKFYAALSTFTIQQTNTSLLRVHLGVFYVAPLALRNHSLTVSALKITLQNMYLKDSCNNQQPLILPNRCFILHKSRALFGLP